MKSTDFVEMAKDIATKYKTLYIMGCFGSPMNNTNKKRYCNNHSYNKQVNRTNKIRTASADTFGFDCVCLIKGILWGWKGNSNAIYGGAVYNSNGVPDKNADQIMDYCSEISTDFSNIIPGEIVHMSGHVGIYIGDGLVVECTPIWKDGVQITAVGNIERKTGYNTRTWVNHGKLNFIDYVLQAKITTETSVSSPNNELKVGDKVKIIGKGNGSSYGNSNIASGIGWERKILKIWNGRPFPYQVGNSNGTTGFYETDALQKMQK